MDPINLHGYDPYIVELQLTYEYSPVDPLTLAALVDWYKDDAGKDMGTPHPLECTTRYKRLETYRKNWSKL